MSVVTDWLSTVDIHVVSIPMRTRFRGITVREAALLHGPAGWGEFAPFLEYGVAESAAWLAAAREACTTSWPAGVRDAIPINTTVPACDVEQARRIVAAGGAGAVGGTVKVKVAETGQQLADDIARVEAVRAELGPAGKIRVDANAGWSIQEAVAAIRALDRAAGGLEYVEQPCAGLDELAAVRRRVEVPIAADESIRKAEDPMRVVVAGAADIAVLKVAPLGGVARALQVAEACGLPCVVSSAVDTSVGLAAGLALAAALPELDYACGLGTLSLMSGDITGDPLIPELGLTAVRRPDPDTALLAEFAAPADRASWWHARIADCAAAL
ncbi:MAG TPA: o-succinylbenzoate synthase [Mycobacteriales bacterium]|nr:o-succinylbenzoate synthase [Mycobacteriales bacterium]